MHAFHQGPPGTGKTTVLMGLLSAFFHYKNSTNSTKKIMICAPSNTAIDEIINRIYQNGLTVLGNRKPKVVRIGILNPNTTNDVK